MAAGTGAWVEVEEIPIPSVAFIPGYPGDGGLTDRVSIPWEREDFIHRRYPVIILAIRLTHGNRYRTTQTVNELMEVTKWYMDMEEDLEEDSVEEEVLGSVSGVLLLPGLMLAGAEEDSRGACTRGLLQLHLMRPVQRLIPLMGMSGIHPSTVVILPGEQQTILRR